MDINKIIVQNYEWADETLLSFEVLPTDELISVVDKVRELNGCKDMATEKDNDVWYNFWLDVDVEKETLDLWASCNNGEKDHYAQYDIWLSENEKKMLLWKAFRQFTKEVEE